MSNADGMTYTAPEGLALADLDLVGLDGNAFAVIGAVTRSLKEAGNDKEIVDQVRADMMSGDYNHLLRVAMGVTEARSLADGLMRLDVAE